MLHADLPAKVFRKTQTPDAVMLLFLLTPILQLANDDFRFNSVVNL
jgi:hypothetical protein